MTLILIEEVGHVVKTCSIEGCERPFVARGWCAAHHRRWMRHGSPLVRDTIESPGVGAQRFCSVDDCDRPHEARGFCDRHYRAERYRDPEVRRRQSDAQRRYKARKREAA